MLELDRGEHYETLAQVVGVSILAIYNVRNRCKEEDWASAIEEKARSGKPREINSKAHVAITALDGSEPPKGYHRWNPSITS